MPLDWFSLPGIILRGHGIASGIAENGPYPAGALEMQAPLFKERGLDLSLYYKGSLNISIRPYTFTMQRPQYTFRQVHWTDLHPPEDFSFSGCQVVFAGVTYDGWVYYPHPETKIRHFQDPTIIEVIAPFIPGLTYGDRIEILTNPAEIQIHPSQPS